MKLEKWAMIAEIVSGVAIVVSLIFLILEIRENTDATRASTRESITERVERLTLTVATNPGLAGILARDEGFARLGAAGEFTPAETMQLRGFLTALMRNTEEAFLQMKEGRLEESYFRGRLAGMVLMVSFGAGRELYESQRGDYDDEFQELIDREIAIRQVD